MSTSLIEKRNDWFLKSRQIVAQRFEKRKPKKYEEVVLVDIISMFLRRSQAGITLEHFLREGYCRFKDFGFKRRCLTNFFKHGIISPEMENVLKRLPERTEKVFNKVNDRTEWMKDRLYRKHEPYK